MVQNKTAPIFNRAQARRRLIVKAAQDRVVPGEADPGKAVRRVAPCSRQNSIRAENGAILLSPQREKSELNQELL
jgi:hypothetical protein